MGLPKSGADDEHRHSRSSGLSSALRLPNLLHLLACFPFSSSCATHTRVRALALHHRTLRCCSACPAAAAAAVHCVGFCGRSRRYLFCARCHSSLLHRAGIVMVAQRGGARFMPLDRRKRDDSHQVPWSFFYRASSFLSWRSLHPTRSRCELRLGHALVQLPHGLRRTRPYVHLCLGRPLDAPVRLRHHLFLGRPRALVLGLLVLFFLAASLVSLASPSVSSAAGTLTPRPPAAPGTPSR